METNSQDTEVSRCSTDATSPQDDQTVALVRTCIEMSRLRGWADDLQVFYHAGNLRLRGRLPSFHLKQILQTLVKDVHGVRQIQNDVEVAGADARFVSRGQASSRKE